MCDANVGGTIHCKPNTRAWVLNLNSLQCQKHMESLMLTTSSVSQYVYIATLLELTANPNPTRYFCQVHCICLKLRYHVLAEWKYCCCSTSTGTNTPCQRYSVAKVWEDPTEGDLSSRIARKERSSGREHQSDVGLSSKLW